MFPGRDHRIETLHSGERFLSPSHSLYPPPSCVSVSIKQKNPMLHFIKSPPTATQMKVFLASSTWWNPRYYPTTRDFIVLTVMTKAWETTAPTTGSLTVPSTKWGRWTGCTNQAAPRGEQLIHRSTWATERFLRKGLMWSCSQNFIPRACAAVHQPRWQFWDEFINSCCRRLSYSGTSPFRHFLIKAQSEEAKRKRKKRKHFAAQKILGYSFISQFIDNLNDWRDQEDFVWLSSLV